LVIDKPAGPTSHGCVAAVRRAYGLKRVGHGGTLDPAVTGVLPMALGPATRLLPYLQGDKVYRAVVQLGVRTSSDDLEGEVLEHRIPLPLDAAALEEALASFRGEIQQRPPAVSAVHVGGERAYARARRGEVVELAPRPVTIHSLCLLAWDPAEARVELEVRCSAGTYIRSLARDLGEHLGCGGALARLRRTATLGFDLSTAVDLERLASGPPPPLLDPLAALAHLERRQLLEEEWPGWRCGRALPLRAGDVDPVGNGPAAALPDAGPDAGQDLASGLTSPATLARSIAEAPEQVARSTPGDVDVLGQAARTIPGVFEVLGPPACATPGEDIREARTAGSPGGPAGSAASDGPRGAAAADHPAGDAAPDGLAGSEAPDGPAYAILNPDGSLAGIARLDPNGLLRPRLVFDAAG
jgi:tRNA pseudouridine55 synthase